MTLPKERRCAKCGRPFAVKKSTGNSKVCLRCDPPPYARDKGEPDVDFQLEAIVKRERAALKAIRDRAKKTNK